MAIIFDNRGRPVDGSLTIAGVPFQRQDRVLMGLAADRPLAADAHAALPFAYYLATDTQDVTQTDGTNWVAASVGGTGAVSIKGSNLVEQLTEADAVGGTLTFSAAVAYVEIVNTDTTNAGTFTVNGVALVVPAETIVGPIAVGTTPAAAVTVSGATTYIVSRYA